MLFDAREIGIQRDKHFCLNFAFEDYLLLPKEGEDSMGPINVWEMSPYHQHSE